MLGGVMLCITGAEALFADLGHFSIPSIGVRQGKRGPLLVLHHGILAIMHHAKTYSPTIVISVSLRLGLMPRRPSLPLCVCRLDSALRCTPPSSWPTSGRAPTCCSTPRMSALRSTPQCRNRSSGELYESQPSTTTIWTTHVLNAALRMSHSSPPL